MPQLCNIFQSIKFVYLASKLLAVLPYTISSDDGLKIKPCRHSFWFTVLSACMTLFAVVTYPIYIFRTEGYCIWCLLFSDNSNRTSAFTDLPISKYKLIAVRIVNRYLVSAMSGASLIFALYHSAALPLLLRKLNKTDQYFRALLKHSATKFECCISFWIIGGVVIMSMPTMSYYMFVELNKPNISLSGKIAIITVVWESLNSTVCEAQFINLAYLLQVRFRIINNFMSGIQNSSGGKFGKSFKR